MGREGDGESCHELCINGCEIMTYTRAGWALLYESGAVSARGLYEATLAHFGIIYSDVSIFN